MLRKILLISLLFILQHTVGQYTYDFDKNCREAYSKIISLRFGEGQQLIDLEKQTHPDNNIPYLLQNYIYFLTVFIGEEENTFDQLDDKKDDLIDRLEDGDESSPYYRYCLAQVYLQWAVARTKFREYVTAMLEINRSYRMLEKNREDFPDFLPNLINLGLLHTMIGTIPENYNWAKRIAGIKGTIDEGVGEILKVLNEALTNEEYSYYKAECLFYLSFIQMNLMTNKEKTFEYISIIEKDSSSLQNPMAIYAISRIYMANGRNDRAIELLVNRPTSDDYFPFYYLDYLTGLAKLHRLDNDAVNYFYKYVINFKGLNYIKDSYQKIAWYYLVLGNPDKYKEFIGKVEKYGNSVVDADKQAEREAETGNMPNVQLLKARLLFDGGYYEKAKQALIEGNSEKSFVTEPEKLEYTYRMGRIYHEWGQTAKAIPFYEKTIEEGSESPHYFAANAALQLGIIYETKGDYDKALHYYDAAQSMENKEYRNSINQKAKAGINRIENR